jgi:3-keto-5-aminohexanoate cleavage enzyme
MTTVTDIIPSYRMPTERPVIITVAPAGHLTMREDGVPVPYTPEEFAEEAERSFSAGAAVLHLHVREDDGTECLRAERYIETIEAIKARVPEMIIEVSTRGTAINGGVDRGASIPLTSALWGGRPGLKPEMCAVNPCSFNYPGHAFINDPNAVNEQCARIYDAGLVPELDVFDVGHLQHVIRMVNAGVLQLPLSVLIVVGSSGGMAADPATIVHVAGQIPDAFNWTMLGAGRFNFHAATLAMSLGGHVRTGLEDTTYLAPGRKARSNAELVEKMARIAREYGRPIATPSQARELIGTGHHSPAVRAELQLVS